MMLPYTEVNSVPVTVWLWLFMWATSAWGWSQNPWMVIMHVALK